METRPDFRQSVAVVIGINAYDHGVRPLNTASSDARRLAQLLADKHDYEVHLLLDEQASLDAIVRLFGEELPGTVGPDDRVLFYFAGHGVALEGDEGPTGYLLPQDARRGEAESYLHMPWLYDALSALVCRHMLVILDSCFSGAFRWATTRDLVMLPEVIHQERYDRFILDPAWQAIASASHDQKALDELPGTLGERGEADGHSPFAHALFAALEGAGDVVPAGDGDGVITASELYLYLEAQLQPASMEVGHRQTPRLWPLAKHDKGEFIFLVPGHELNLPPAPPLTYENNPWRGLESYDETHAELFFGRDDVIEVLRRTVEDHPLTVVLGASGTGKSSVVKAGLVPELKRDVAQQWHVLPIVRPGAIPMQALERAIADLGGEGSVENRIAAWSDAHPDARLVLVVDQFEELVTMTRGVEEREAMLGLLLRLVEAHPTQLRLILTLRSDFEPQFDRSVLEPHWKQARYVVPPMTQDEVRAVIEQPASRRVMYFKPSDLVDTLINEVIQTPGGLPLLSFALSEMYVHYIDRRSDDRAIETQDYEAVGGVVGALRTRADAEFGSLNPAHRETMRRLMLRMVAADGGNVARRRVPHSELEYPDPAETARAREVVRRLTAARLVVEGRGDDGEAYVEPAHDALVRAWDRLLGWIHAEHDRTANLRFQQNLARVARDWTQAEDEKMKAGLLWRDAARGGVLAQLVTVEEEALDQGALTTGQRMQRHIRTLQRRLRPSNRAGESSRWMNRRELAFARRSIRRRRNIRLGLTGLVLLIVAGAIAAGLFGVEAERQRQQAVVERDNALASSLAARSYSALQDGINDLATLLGVQGARVKNTPQTRESLLLTLQAGAYARLRWENEATRPQTSYRLYPHPGAEPDCEDAIDRLAFADDSLLLIREALPNGQRTLDLWDLTTQQMLGSLDYDALLADASASASQYGLSDERYARMREAARELMGPLPDPGAVAVQPERLALTAEAISPDGTLRANGEFLGIELWEVESNARLQKETGYAGYVTSLAFNESGSILATGTDRGEIKLWDVVDTEARFHTTLPIPSDVFLDPPAALVYNQQGTDVALFSDSTLWLWDGLSTSPTGETRVPLRDEYDSVEVQFTPTGAHVVLTESALGYEREDGRDTVRVHTWDVGQQRWLEPMLLPGVGALSPTGEHTAVWEGSTLRLWNTTQRTYAEPPIALTGEIDAVHFSPDGAYLEIVTGGDDLGSSTSRVHIWDVPARRFVAAPFDIPSYLAFGKVNRFDGQTLRALDFPVVRTWAMGESSVEADSILLADVLPRFANGYDGPEAVMSPSGALMAFGDCYTDCINPDIALLDMNRKEAVWGSFAFQGEGADSPMMRSFSFSPNEELLLIESQGGDVQLWDVEGREELGLPLWHPGDADLLAFSPDGAHLAVAGYDWGEAEDGSDAKLFLRQWDLHPSTWIQQACEIVNRNLSTQEWEVFMDDRPYACTCPNLPPHPDTGLSACP